MFSLVLSSFTQSFALIVAVVRGSVLLNQGIPLWMQQGPSASSALLAVPEWVVCEPVGVSKLIIILVCQTRSSSHCLLIVVW